ncbi:MAG: hypothetical protein PHO75_01295 [Candidatus Shapirobacteria bacterium]|jgi:hypothetical protein|nr:hypothetical protein [Candidatus Shapirobacteria bacterium]
MVQITNKILAAQSYQLTGPGIQPTSNSVGQLEKIISSVIGILTIFGVIYFTIQIILAGFTMISSQGDPKELESSKKRLTTNVLGLAIIILAYGIGALLAKLLGINSIFDLSTVFVQIK